MTFHKQLQNYILLYLDLDENVEENFQNLMNFINNQNIQKDINEFRLFLHFINTISNYHYRTKNFLSKIEKILISFKDDFSNFLTNGEILDIFENNKIALFLLIENGILIADQYFENYIEDYDKEDYYSYFENKINTDELFDDDFEKSQKAGENEQIICKYIRDDNISEFITYVVKEELSLNSTIKQSIFETNPFLLNKRTTLIEYSAFFGSIQIFTYLYKNKVKLTSSIWPYAIHGFNPEIIIILEENKISPENNNYYEILEESIKCHHNDITSYIKENFLQKDLMVNEFIEFQSIKYYNFDNFPIDLYQNRKQFYYYCKYDYFYFVEQYLKNKDIDINFQMNDSYNEYSYILTPLLVSVKNNYFNITKLLLNQPNIDLNFNVSCIDFKENNETLNALIYTIMNNNPKMAKLFLDDDRFDVKNSLIIREYMDDNKLKIDEYYPLHEAIISNNIEITKFLLLHQKINVNAIQKITIFDTSEKSVYKINEITVLQKAISNNNIEITKVLLENRDIDVNKYSITKIDKKITKETPLYSAILNENYEIIKLLLEHPNIDVNKKSIDEKPTFLNKIAINENLPLKQAIDNNNYEIIMLLLNNPKIDINQYFTSNNGNSEIKQTLLNYCIYNSKIEIVKLLLNHPNIDVNLPSFIKNHIEEKYITPLNMLIEKQNIDLIKLILSNKKIDVNKISNIINDNSQSQQTPLISAIKNVNNSDIVMCLLEHPNIDVNLYVDQIIEADKKTKINPLLIATSLNLIEIAQYLFINPNLDVNAKYIIEDEKNIDEKNSLILAIENENINFVKLLANHNNIDINSKLVSKSKNYSLISETTILHLAIKKGNAEIVKSILQNPKIDINLSSFETQNYRKYIKKVETPTICLSAFYYFDDEFFQLLLSNKNLDLNAKLKTTKIESTGFFVTEQTALQCAVKINNSTSFNFLFNFLRENKALNDDLNNLLKMTSNIKIKSALYDEINKQS